MKGRIVQHMFLALH